MGARPFFFKSQDADHDNANFLVGKNTAGTAVKEDGDVFKSQVSDF